MEHGAADIGVSGKDIIMEENRHIYEVLDLGFGKCRMCICGFPEAAELLNHHEMIKVATKYPRIARDYFHNKKFQTVDIIKLNGSIELAPIVGLSDVICDIVETGSTLRENGLSVLEEVCPLSARMVVNQVSMRMEAERIREAIPTMTPVMINGILILFDNISFAPHFYPERPISAFSMQIYSCSAAVRLYRAYPSGRYDRSKHF